MSGQTYGDLEGSDDDDVQLPLPLVKKLSKRLKKLKKRLRREQKERRIREVVRKAKQDDLWDDALAPVARKNADQAEKPPPEAGKVTYPEPVEFDEKLRRTLKRLCDPAEYDKLTVKRVTAKDGMNIAANTLWPLLKRYGYAREGETLSKCLNRLADEWHPQWRDVNRQSI